MKFYLLILSFLICPFLSNAQEIQFLTHSTGNQAFIDNQGQLRGKPHSGKRAFNIELVRALMQGTPYEHNSIIEYPLLRITQDMLPKGGAAAFNIARSPSRVHLLKWVGPLQTDRLYFYRLKSDAQVPKSLKEIQKNSITCIKNGGFLQKHLNSIGFTDLVTVNEYSHCFKMLLTKRVDFAVISQLSLNSVLELSNIAENLIEEALLYKEINGFIAFSLNTSNHLITLWQNKLDRFHRDGTYQELKEQFFLPSGSK